MLVACSANGAAPTPVTAPAPGSAPAAAEPGAAELAADMADAARRFLSSLPRQLAARARIDFDAADRTDWHYIPRTRRGVALGDLTDAQRALAYGFLATALSRRGLIKATTIMALEDVLRAREGGRGAYARDAGGYYLTVFGEPSTTASWGWRLEGHHLPLNLTLVGGTTPISAPAFFGAAPMEPGAGLLAGTRALGAEAALGFRVLDALPAALRADAVADTA